MHPITILSIGPLKKPFWQQAVQHYRRCLRARVRLEWIVIPERRTAGERGLQEEAQRIHGHVTHRHRLLALHETGPARTSVQFAALLGGLWESGQVPCFVVGGPFGLPPQVLNAAWTHVSLGPMTLPHELALVVLFEQLYRAHTILRGEAYHH